MGGCEPSLDKDNDGDKDAEPSGSSLGFEDITREQCKNANGYWNECGSPCAGTGAKMCIQMCQIQCECSGIAGFSCPEGYKCRLAGKIADEIGVCVRE